MAFTDAFIRNLKTIKSMEDFREKAGENFGALAYVWPPAGAKDFTNAGMSAAGIGRE